MLAAVDLLREVSIESKVDRKRNEVLKLRNRRSDAATIRFDPNEGGAVENEMRVAVEDGEDAKYRRNRQTTNPKKERAFLDHCPNRQFPSRVEAL